jgi:hypothetical protein
MIISKGRCIMRSQEAAMAAAAPEHHYFSVRLAGMSVWEEHLGSRKLAHDSAEEPRALGLLDVHIIDEQTGQCLE